jgi:NAD(P)-dependent dehydrogenase (short-subunit alcohol dehydrogenase family)
MAINVRGVYLGCKYAVIQFKQQGGGGRDREHRIRGRHGRLGRHGLRSHQGCGEPDHPRDRHRVRAVRHSCERGLPAGMPFTNFSVPDAEAGSQGMGDEMGDAVGSMHPLGRPITAEDAAEAALFLASDMAGNITGVLLPVDGGYVAR